MPSLNSTEGGKYPTMIPAGHFEHPSISYIDLDLPPAPGDHDHDAASVVDGSVCGPVRSAVQRVQGGPARSRWEDHLD